MTGTPTAWETTLWAEFETMTLDEQILVSGEWITHITRNLLPELAKRRRLAVTAALRVEGTDLGILADRLGSRKIALERLASEGRAFEKAELLAA